MSNDSLRGFLLTLNQEQKTKQRQELREQEVKRLEAENLAETRKSKEELSVIAAPPGWDIKKAIADDADQLLSDMVDGACSRDVIEPANAKVIQLNGNDIEFSGLLNIPKKIDDWFEVIDAMAKDFYQKFNKIPTEAQAWSWLHSDPPNGYTLTADTDRGEDCLKMPGIKNLGRKSFNGRWEKYTTQKSQ